LETVILVPALLLFGGLLIFAGRAALARQAVEQAAWDAAREASIARTPAEARAKATDRATALLTDLGCQPTVTVDTSAFALPVSQAASVTADVSCRVDLSQLTVPGLPGQIVLQATSSSSLDTYRGRR
jgi:Flp pilus assembly protein TadG